MAGREERRGRGTLFIFLSGIREIRFFLEGRVESGGAKGGGFGGGEGAIPKHEFVDESVEPAPVGSAPRADVEAGGRHEGRAGLDEGFSGFFAIEPEGEGEPVAFRLAVERRCGRGEDVIGMDQDGKISCAIVAQYKAICF